MYSKKTNFRVGKGIYKYKFSLVDVIKRILYYLIVIFPFPSRFKASIFKFLGIKIKNTKKVFIGYNVWIDYANLSSISIGEHVIIGTGVKIIAHSGGTFLQQDLIENKLAGIEIDDGCLIGINSIILPGVKIGKCAVVSAGSVVSKSIPPYVVVAGNPAKIIKNLKK